VGQSLGGHAKSAPCAQLHPEKATQSICCYKT
jgi:hypothetical protein